MTLTLLPTAHDLPPRWDGHDVEWKPWHHVWSSAQWHIPDEDRACTACGLIAEPLHAAGWVQPLPGQTCTVADERTLPSGRVYVRGLTPSKEIPAYPLLCLNATRCTGCGHDVVHDQRTGQTWDLGPEDYGPHGSSETVGSLW